MSSSKSFQEQLDFFYKIRHLVPFEVIKILYYSLFYSFISYEIVVWGFTHKAYVQKIFLLLKKNVRVMTFASKTDHSNSIFANLEFLKIDSIRQLQSLSVVYDCQNKLAPVHFHDYFVPCSQVHRFNTRLASRSDLFLDRKIHFNMEFGPLSLLVRCMLPVPLRESSVVHVFHAELKKHLLSSYNALL